MVNSSIIASHSKEDGVWMGQEEEIKMSKMLDPEEVKVQDDQLLTEREELLGCSCT